MTPPHPHLLRPSRSILRSGEIEVHPDRIVDREPVTAVKPSRRGVRHLGLEEDRGCAALPGSGDEAVEQHRPGPGPGLDQIDLVQQDVVPAGFDAVAPGDHGVAVQAIFPRYHPHLAMCVVGEEWLESGGDPLPVKWVTVDETELLAERQQLGEVRRLSLSDIAQPRASASDSSNTWRVVATSSSVWAAHTNHGSSASGQGITPLLIMAKRTSS